MNAPVAIQGEIVTAQDLEKTRAELKVELDPFLARAQEVEIYAEEDVEEATEYLGDLARRAKMIEAKRKELKDPITKWGKEIDTYFKTLSEPIAAARKLVEPKILAWKEAEQRRIDEENARVAAEVARQQEIENERQRKIADEAAEKLREAEAAGNEEEARRAGIELAVASEVRTVQHNLPPAEQEKTIRAAGATASMRSTWKATVVDPMEVPREYLMVNEKAINEAVRKAGDPSTLVIPGVAIEEVKSLAVKA